MIKKNFRDLANETNFFIQITIAKLSTKVKNHEIKGVYQLPLLHYIDSTVLMSPELEVLKF